MKLSLYNKLFWKLLLPGEFNVFILRTAIYQDTLLKTTSYSEAVL